MQTMYRVSKYQHSRRNGVLLFATDEIDAIRAYAALHFSSAVQRDGDGWRLGTAKNGSFTAHGPRLFAVADARQDEGDDDEQRTKRISPRAASDAERLS